MKVVIRSFRGKTPRIAESAFVSESAYIVGDVEIGEGSGVFPGAVIRADFTSIKIGQNTMVEDNTVIHSGVPVEIGDNVIIGHSAVVHCVKIGNNNLIGSNATLLDFAEIGNHCIIGAGCLVSQGMKVPDNSMVVGIPGRIRDIGERKKQRMTDSTLTYSDLVKLYKQEGL